MVSKWVIIHNIPRLERCLPKKNSAFGRRPHGGPNCILGLTVFGLERVCLLYTVTNCQIT